MNESKRNTVFIIVSLLLIGFAGYRLMTANKAAAIVPKEFVGEGVCLACKQEVTLKYDSGELPPFECPACGEKAAYLWMYCNECRHRFIPELVRLTPDAPPRPKPYFDCPNCGCTSYTNYRPDDEMQHVAGDAQLPHWPVP